MQEENYILNFKNIHNLNLITTRQYNSTINFSKLILIEHFYTKLYNRINRR
jgi:hypothetical protein